MKEKVNKLINVIKKDGIIKASKKTIKYLNKYSPDPLIQFDISACASPSVKSQFAPP